MGRGWVIRRGTTRLAGPEVFILQILRAVLSEILSFFGSDFFLEFLCEAVAQLVCSRNDGENAETQ